MAVRDGAHGARGSINRDIPNHGGPGISSTEIPIAREGTPESSGPRLRKVCAWCQKRGHLTVLEEGDPGAPTTHGVCEKCRPHVMADTARAIGFKVAGHTLEPQRRSYHYGQTLGEVEGWKGEIVIEIPRHVASYGEAVEYAKALATDELPGFDVLEWHETREGNLVHLTPAEAEEVARG